MKSVAVAAGQPNLACSVWLQDWSDPAKHEGQLEWILGFVTGSNYRSEGQGQLEDTAEVEVFIEHYCRNNPEHQLFMAAATLVQESGGPAALHAFKKEGDGDSGEMFARTPDAKRRQVKSWICHDCGLRHSISSPDPTPVSGDGPELYDKRGCALREEYRCERRRERARSQ